MQIFVQSDPRSTGVVCEQLDMMCKPLPIYSDSSVTISGNLANKPTNQQTHAAKTDTSPDVAGTRQISYIIIIIIINLFIPFT